MGLAGDNKEYLVASFAETAQSKYRMMILDKSGRVVFKTSDEAFPRHVYITGKVLHFYNITAGTVCTGELE